MELTAPPDLLAEKDLDWERCEAVCYRALDQVWQSGGRELTLFWLVHF